MEKEWIEFIRQKYDIPVTMTDEEIDRLESKVESLPRTSSFLRVANLIELMELRKTALPDMPQLGVFPSGYDPLWQGCCESMFIEGWYGPCCIWARATVELILHELCLSDTLVSKKFHDYIKQRGYNPGVRECRKMLGNSLSQDDRSACDILAKNGDWVVHHRLDEIVGKKSLVDVLREWGVAEAYLDRPGFKNHERMMLMGNRYKNEREMAKASMKALYEFLSRRARSDS